MPPDSRSEPRQSATDFELRIRGEITAEEYVKRIDARVQRAKDQHTDADERRGAEVVDA